MYTIAAHSGLGKSAIALSIAAQWARCGHRVLFFTLEMTKDEQINRLVVMEGEYDINVVESAHRQPEHVKERIIEAAWLYYERYIHFHDRQSTFADIAALTAEARELPGRLLVVIDYLGLIRGGDELKGHERLSKITEDLKDMSKAGDGCAVLLLAQLNRDGDLFGSDGAKRDADAVLFFKRDKPDVAKSTLTMKVEKIRNGPGTGEERYFASIDSDLLLREIPASSRTSEQI